MEPLLGTVQTKVYETDKCGICWDNFADNLPLLLKCGHIFHENCINKYLDYTVSPVCLYCKKEITILSKALEKRAALEKKRDMFSAFLSQSTFFLLFLVLDPLHLEDTPEGMIPILSYALIILLLGGERIMNFTAKKLLTDRIISQIFRD